MPTTCVGGGYGRDDRSDEGSQRGDDGPSRADMSDNWGRDTKFNSGGGGGGGRTGAGFGSARSGGFGGSRDGSADGRYEETSRADNSSSWGNKQFVPSVRTGGGFDERPSRGFDDRGARNYEFSDRDSSRAGKYLTPFCPCDFPRVYSLERLVFNFLAVSQNC